MPASSKEFLDIQATIKCGFTLKRVGDMTRIYSQMHRTDRYSEHSSIIKKKEWPAWPNGWVFVYKLSGSGFECSCSYLNFRFCSCLKQEVPLHSGNYRVGIHSETRTWHDTVKCTIQIGTQNTAQSLKKNKNGQFGQMVECLFSN